MRIIRTVDGHATTCVSQVRGVDGNLLTDGVVTGVLRKEFGNLGTTDLDDIGEILDTPVTDSKLWNPGVDGSEGYNFQAIIPADSLTGPGTYRAEFSITEDDQVYKSIFKIHVGSG